MDPPIKKEKVKITVLGHMMDPVKRFGAVSTWIFFFFEL